MDTRDLPLLDVGCTGVLLYAFAGEDLRANGVLFQTFPYTSDPSVFAKLLDLGVMSFATDHPDVAMGVTTTLVRRFQGGGRAPAPTDLR